MKNILFITALLSLLIPQTSFSQLFSIKKFDDYISVNSNDNYEYSVFTKPITNREYIAYLIWLNNIFIEYPQIFIDAFPNTFTDEEIRLISNEIYPFGKYVEMSAPIVKNYIFNPKYLDYPVINISWEQAINFSKWYSDRANEYLLINNRIILSDPLQLGCRNFTTESFIGEQYEVMYTSKADLDQCYNNFLTPTYRLITKYELENSNVQSFQLKEYKNSSFLDLWETGIIEKKGNLYLYDSYFERKRFGYRIFLGDEICHILTPQNADIIEENTKIEEYTLDDKAQTHEKNFLQVYKNLGQEIVTLDNDIYSWPDKNDTTGQMVFIFIARNAKKEPIFISSLKDSSIISNNYFEKFRTFRLVQNI